MLALPAFLFALDYERFRHILGKSDLPGEKQRAFACEQNMPAVFQNAAREIDWILDSRNRRHCAGAKRVTFHDCCIHLDFTEAVQRRAGAGIEEWIVFETNDS